MEAEVFWGNLTTFKLSDLINKTLHIREIVEDKCKITIAYDQKDKIFYVLKIEIPVPQEI